MRFLLILTLATLALAAQPNSYVAPRAPQPITIDGHLDAQWQQAPWTSLFLDIEGPQKTKPRFQTRAKMQWDEKYFYIAAELEEPHVWGTLTKHDSVIFHDNDFELFVDPNSDSHEYFEFEMNALNTTWDLFLPKPYKDSGSADNSWEIPGLRTAVQVQGTINNHTDTDKGWTLEIAIPWTAFGKAAHMPLPPKPNDIWRVNFSRVEWHHEIHEGKYRRVPNTKEDNWVWSPQGKVNMHLPEHWGYVQFANKTGTLAADPSYPNRMRLQSYYQRQYDYRKANNRWATAKELPPEKDIDFLPAPNAWRACLANVCIQHDAKVTPR
jgi:hypothetical protein